MLIYALNSHPNEIMAAVEHWIASTTGISGRILRYATGGYTMVIRAFHRRALDTERDAGRQEGIHEGQSQTELETVEWLKQQAAEGNIPDDLWRRYLERHNAKGP